MYDIELNPEIMESVRMVSEKLSEMKISKQLKELSQKAAECTQTITAQLRPLMEQFDHTTQMVQDAIPNIRYIQENLNLETPEFLKNITLMMQTLDFPVVQPEITRGQLRDRLENMNRTELETVKISALAAVNSVPQKEVHRPSVKKMLSIAFTVIITVITITDSIFSISDHFNKSDNGTDIFVNGCHNNVVVNVHDGSSFDDDYYFENEQTQEDTELDALKEQSSSTTVIIPNTNCNTN